MAASKSGCVSPRWLPQIARHGSPGAARPNTGNYVDSADEADRLAVVDGGLVPIIALTVVDIAPYARGILQRGWY